MGETTPSMSAPGETAAPHRPVEKLLTLSAARERTNDDHMFRLTCGATCRLQVFTAPDARPVVVATQTHDEGVSLTNGGERFAATAWKRYCPEERQPPVFIQRQLQDHQDPRLASRLREEFELVTFGEAQPYDLHFPGWQPLTDEQVEALVGQPVATDRGSGYVPRPPEPEPKLFFEMTPLSELAVPRPFRAPKCMPKRRSPRIRRLLLRLMGRRCCWYHGGDWRRVNAMAEQVLVRAQETEVETRHMEEAAGQWAEELGASEWEIDALWTLFRLGRAIVASAEGYTNGNHRVRAMLDTGVSHTVVLRHIYPSDEER
ncbi:hypothetical protein [Streptomyces qinglanensis]|uniref:hypothetical protein n=1 Tax=Streptomyces qinglanensis TaxID=943816 RepID=UPI003D74F835